MKALVVLSVASMLGTGCVVSDICDARTVSVGWPSFRLANDAVVTTCGGAQVSWVDVFIDGAPVVNPAPGSNGHFLCSDGGVNVTQVLNEADHRFTVEALDSVSGAIALRDEFTVSPSNCVDVLVNAQPSKGTFTLDFDLGGASCPSATDAFIWFTIRDDTTGTSRIAVDTSHTPQAWTCGNGQGGTTPTPISFALASGPYTLQRAQEVLYPGPAHQAGYCPAGGVAFDMFGGHETTAPVTLTSGVDCF